MKLMPIKQAQAKLLNATADKNLQMITLSTFKKDRSITLKREPDEGQDERQSAWLLIEDGFEHAQAKLEPGASGKRLVKEAFKREFPRSTRAYVAEVHQ